MEGKKESLDLEIKEIQTKLSAATDDIHIRNERLGTTTSQIICEAGAFSAIGYDSLFGVVGTTILPQMMQAGLYSGSGG